MRERIDMKKCLIVDDEIFCGELLAAMLRKHFHCHTLTSGKEAWEVIESGWHKGEAFDLICCDLTMPELSGHGLIRKIRSLEETVPKPGVAPSKVVVVSAGSYPWEMGEALLHDVADGYLSKPCNPKELYELLIKCGVLGSDEV